LFHSNGFDVLTLGVFQLEVKFEATPEAGMGLNCVVHEAVEERAEESKDNEHNYTKLGSLGQKKQRMDIMVSEKDASYLTGLVMS
jgi:hypothetical protein